MSQIDYNRVRKTAKDSATLALLLGIISGLSTSAILIKLGVMDRYVDGGHTVEEKVGRIILFFLGCCIIVPAVVTCCFVGTAAVAESCFSFMEKKNNDNDHDVEAVLSSSFDVKLLPCDSSKPGPYGATFFNISINDFHEPPSSSYDKPISMSHSAQ